MLCNLAAPVGLYSLCSFYMYIARNSKSWFLPINGKQCKQAMKNNMLITASMVLSPNILHFYYFTYFYSFLFLFFLVIFVSNNVAHDKGWQEHRARILCQEEAVNA